MNKLINLYIIPSIIILFLFAISDILLPFILAISISYFISPIVEKINNKIHYKAISILLVMLFFAIILITVNMILIPVVISQLVDLIKNVPEYIQQIYSHYINFIQNYMDHMDQDSNGTITHLIDVDHIKELTVQKLSLCITNIASNITNTILLSGINIIKTMLLVIIVPIISFYVLYDWHNFKQAVQHMIPPKYSGTVNEYMNNISEIISTYMQGQLLVCLSLSIIYSTSLGLLGVKYGFLIGLITGLLTFFPYIGFIFGVATSSVMAIIHSSNEQLIYVLIIFASTQILEGYFLTPKFVGNKLGLHPIWVVFSTFSGAALMGFTGILLSIPVAAVVATLLKEYIKTYREEYTS